MRTNGSGNRVRRAHSRFVTRFLLVVTFLALCAPGVVSAELQLPGQISADPWSNLLPLSSRNSLLDPSKLSISHELVFSYSSGLTSQGNTNGLFLTRFEYPLSNPLKLGLTIGSSLSHSGLQGFQANELFLQNLSLRYAPNDKFLLFFMYNGAPYNRFYFPTR